jgi:asparagine synthase (glutamine-hydrolysing)
MCGISGIYGLENLHQPLEMVRKMNRALAHRGPDAEGEFQGENIVLGHRRLAIIDLSDRGRQPMHDEANGISVVFNGEIYNYLELREELRDYPFRTDTDTEVIIAAWSKWGSACLQRFNGMFAIALWDDKKQCLFLARDRMGIKPLYYAYRGSSIIFASEIRAILATGLIPREMDTDSLVDYLRYQTVHAPYTMVKGVSMLQPGNFLMLRDDEVQEVQYWNPLASYSREASLMNPEEIRQHIGELLLDSVKLRMRADVPFGAFLSGGIDSSTIVALMSRVAGHKVNTFTISFNECDYSESTFAAMIAEKFGSEHHDIRLSASSFVDLLPEALEAMDHPSGDGPNTWLVSKITRNAGITMALSGLGGDELFAGYPVFKRSVKLLDQKWVLSFPKPLRVLGASVLRTMKPGVNSQKITELLRQDYLDLEYSYPLSRACYLDYDIRTLLRQTSLPENRVARILAEEVSFGSPGFDLPFLSRVSHAEIRSYLQNVLLRDTDQMSMAHALEVRVPFLDHRLVEFVYGIPDSIKYPHSPKKLLTESMRGLLPTEVINRPKMGFTLPWEFWMKHELFELCNSRLERLALRPEFEGAQIRRIWHSFLKGKDQYGWSRIWPLVVLSNWLEKTQID